MSKTHSPTKIAVFISGSGTNLQALIDASSSPSPKLPNARISVVLSSSKNAYGLTRAQNASIPTLVHNILPYKKEQPSQTGETSDAARHKYCHDLAQLILDQEPRPELIVCAGFMMVLTPSFLNPMAAAGIKLINLHPALYKAFDGKDAIQRAHAAFQRGEIKKTGIMIHEVVEEVDRGQPILQQEVDMRQGESLEELMERMHEIEHRAIVEGAKKAVEPIRQR